MRQPCQTPVLILESKPRSAKTDRAYVDAPHSHQPPYRCSSPAFSRTAPHFLYSAATNSAHASGAEPFTITPVLVRRAFVSGSSRISFSTLLSFKTTGFGMPFGP